MSHTFIELKKKTVAELREIAKDVEHEAVQGYSQMNKEHLLVALCKALGIDTHVHHEVKGLNKAGVKARIRTLKEKLDAAITAGDRKQIKFYHRQIHKQKRQIHKATV
jgi:DNA-binding IclR family transcriptional regulator